MTTNESSRRYYTDIMFESAARPDLLWHYTDGSFDPSALLSKSGFETIVSESKSSLRFND